MRTETDRVIDADIVNLSGGLFDRSYLTAPAPPEPEIAVPDRGAARTQARRARRASRIVATVAAAVLVGGLAAAQQVASSSNVHAVAATALPTGALPAAPSALHGAAVAAVSPPDTPDKPENSPAEQAASAPASPPPASTTRRAPDPMPAPRPAEPAPVAPALPAAPAPSLEALAAGHSDFDRAAAAVSIAAAARSAGACVSPEDTERTARVRVTFSTTGRVLSATIEGGSLTATEAGACVARALRGARIHAFEGEPVAVTTTVHL